MKDQIISFETAKLAKEKGLISGVESYGYYCIGFKSIDPIKDDLVSTNLRTTIGKQYHLALAPTQSLLQRWLREIHYIDVESRTIRYAGDDKSSGYSSYINGSITDLGNKFKTYEDALEDALVKGLNLIKDEN